MASDINKVLCIGRLTRDPELRETQGGLQLCELGIAVNNAAKKGDVWEDEASFFNATVFGKRAETVAKFCRKGERVAVLGRLQQRRWEAEDGTKREKVSIVADTVQFLKEKPAAVSQEAPF